jgi:hypothetical protein
MERQALAARRLGRELFVHRGGLLKWKERRDEMEGQKRRNDCIVSKGMPMESFLSHWRIKCSAQNCGPLVKRWGIQISILKPGFVALG